MGRNPPKGMQRIIPYLSYADAPAAIDFLCKAFGFEERFRYPMPGGRIGHAELGYLDNVVMLASAYEGFGESPLRLPAVHGQVYCFVEDVDAHFARAQKGGATIASEPKNEHGTRFYRAIDPEGHRWIFSTPLSEAKA
jgi:PhnB protein